MISVILYGRNDAHGYNLHRRAALSLNCLAEVLTDPDDEIVFVDYNSPDELPTFVEAIADTLTDRCLDVLRVLRIPAEIHHERFASRTHLTAIEPVSRNAAARRANPANRWLLSTNTDMVFLPLEGDSLSEVCADLPDAYYGLPRFELPEWLWERLPRSEPEGVLVDLRRLGPGLRLDESTAHHEWIRFDAPGDFQLITRDDYIGIDGFDEAMILGYHVDANLSRRMLLRRGSIESLEDRVAGYHCNHNRVPTVYHGERPVANDLDRFFLRVDRSDLPHQRSTWGLADVVLEEVPVRRRVELSVAHRVASVLPATLPPLRWTDAQGIGEGLTYDSGHVLSFVADSILVSAPSKVGYVGANPVLQQLLAALVTELGSDASLEIVNLDDLGSVESIDATAEVIVVDLGTDSMLVDGRRTDSGSDGDYRLEAFMRAIERVVLALERLVQLERARIKRGEHPRRFVLVNSNATYWHAYIVANFDCSYATFHARVSRGRVRRTESTETVSIASREFSSRLLTWSRRWEAADGRLRLRKGHRMRIADLREFVGFGAGWAFPDAIGIWTQGRRSELSLAFDGAQRDSVLTLGIGGVCASAGESLRVVLLADGEEVASRDFMSGDTHVPLGSLRRPLPSDVLERARRKVPARVLNRLRPLYVRLTAHPAAPGAPQFTEIAWRVELPSDVGARGDANLTLVVDEPRTPLAVGWSADERPLGIHVRSLEVERGDIRQRSADGLG